MEPFVPQKAVQAEVRRYLARVARRYIPLIVGAAAVLLVALLLPSVSNNPANSFQASQGPLSGQGLQGSANGSGTPASGATTAAQGGTANAASGATQTATSGGSISSNGNGISTGGGPVGVTTGTQSAAQEPAGVSKTGIKCGPGVRQFTWSAYAPYCVPAWHGNNGGSTAQGVTATTITLTYRETSSSSDATAEAYATGADAGSDPQYVQDLQTYIKFFNTQFELYGRHVVLKAYNGQGNPLLEDQGQDLQGAQADAATAQSLGAFSDVSMPLGSATGPYDDDLAQDHISSWGDLYVGPRELQQYSPYLFSVLYPSGATANNEFLDIMCRRMVGLPAIFSGDPTMQVQTRKFGLILPDRPGSNTSESQLDSGMKACGGSFADTALYTINVGEMPAQAASILAQFHSMGITTVMCGCDPIFDAVLAQQADDQRYYPEWLSVWWSDAFGQLVSQDQWSHDMANGGATPNLAKTEAYTAFKLADPHGQPAEAFYSVPYLMLLQIFSAIQAAGPDLTPASFANAYFHLPGGNGTFGPLGFAPNKYNPTVAFQVGWWDPKATSNFNGKAGAYESCDNNQWVYFNDMAALGPDHTQLQCFGK